MSTKPLRSRLGSLARTGRGLVGNLRVGHDARVFGVVIVSVEPAKIVLVTHLADDTSEEIGSGSARHEAGKLLARAI